jgi:hypothetical protein
MSALKYFCRSKSSHQNLHATVTKKVTFLVLRKFPISTNAIITIRLTPHPSGIRIARQF